MRRQIGVGGAQPAGSGRAERLDPLSLPVAFEASDARADGHTRRIELNYDGVVVRRAVRGISMTINLRMRDYRGIALRIDETSDSESRVTLTLEHRDPSLSIVLQDGADDDAMTRDWQAWSTLLALPQLVATPEGNLHNPFRNRASMPRRRRHNAIRRRRPMFLLRRRAPVARPLVIHDAEREIIARN